jgi:hypothetical protein
VERAIARQYSINGSIKLMPCEQINEIPTVVVLIDVASGEMQSFKVEVE